VQGACLRRMGWFNGKREKKSLEDRSVLTGDVTDKIKPVDGVLPGVIRPVVAQCVCAPAQRTGRRLGARRTVTGAMRHVRVRVLCVCAPRADTLCVCTRVRVVCVFSSDLRSQTDAGSQRARRPACTTTPPAGAACSACSTQPQQTHWPCCSRAGVCV
jgi:hypothetical protein